LDCLNNSFSNFIDLVRKKIIIAILELKKKKERKKRKEKKGKRIILIHKFE
jgi:hypothetical protein